MRLSRLGAAAVALLCAGGISVPLPDHGDASALPIPASAVIDGHPATWPACSTIGYTLNVTHAPPGSIDDVRAVLADLSSATGLRFAYRGLSDRLPQSGDLDNGPTRTDAPLTIAWSSPPAADGTVGTGSDLLAGRGETAGRTVTTDEYRPRRGVIPPRHDLVAADVVLDASLTSDVDGTTWGGVGGQRAFLQHELAHAVGLDHSNHVGSVLAPRLPSGKYATYSPFDRAALKALAGQAGPCPGS